MKTDITSRIAAIFMCLILVTPDAFASVRAFSLGLPDVQMTRNNMDQDVSNSSEDEDKHQSSSSSYISPIGQSSYSTTQYQRIGTYGARNAEVSSSSVLIGKSHKDPMNNPRDDFFSFEVELSDFQRYTHAEVSYKVKGVTTGKALVKSVNDGPSYGDLELLEPSDVWVVSEDVIKLENLVPGTNLMRFGLPSRSLLHAELKDFEVSLVDEREMTLPNAYIEEELVSDADLFEYTGNDNVQLYKATDIQVPSVPTDIVNVTKGSFAYRIRTDSTIAGGLIGVAIDIERIPAGKTPKEVSTFYFNYEQRGWVPVSMDSVHVDITRGIAINYVPLQPGTQYFNGVISTPNMPESSANLSTSMAGIQPANPAEGIVGVSAPQISRTGEASTSFPIKMPPGRNGMQPSLAITYSSDAGTGWLGVGWNVIIPKITVDTRWGVPEYSPTEQTEIYLLNGESLAEEGEVKPNKVDLSGAPTPTPLRQNGPREFFQKNRSSWQSIVRHGNSPSTYYWVVTTADQTQLFYGKMDASDQVNPSAVLRHPSTHNIAEWYLTKIKDKWGNTVEYTYDVAVVPSSVSKAAMHGAAQVVLQQIDYTGFEDGATNDPGNYRIIFNTSNDRGDASMQLRYGYKVADQLRLNTIEIGRHDGTVFNEVRTYVLDYGSTPNASTHFKTRLNSIAETVGGEVFYSNDFEYFDAEYRFGDGASSNEVSHFNLPANSEGLMEADIEGFSRGGSAGVTWGFFPVAYTIDGSYNYSEQDDDIVKNFIDINGDGVLDYVVSNSGGLKFYKGYINQDGEYKLDYNIQSVAGSYIPKTVTSTTASSNVGSVQFSYEATTESGLIGVNSSFTHSTTSTYPVDLNADGILDWANNGKTYYGSYNPTTDQITYNASSKNSPNPIVNTVDVETIDVENGEMPVETVLSWRAPYDGTVNISSVARVRSSSDEGIAFQIDKAGPSSSSIVFGETKVNPSINQNIDVTGVSVNEGDYLLFRAKTGKNGRGDIAEWDPTVAYVTGSTQDANGVDYGSFVRSDEFNIMGHDPVRVSDASNVSLTFINGGTKIFGPFTDQVEFEMYMSYDDGTTISEQTSTHVIDPNSTDKIELTDFSFSNMSTTWSALKSGTLNLSASESIILHFTVRSRSNIKWTDYNWRPKLDFDKGSESYDLHPVVDAIVWNYPLAYEGSTELSNITSASNIRFSPYLSSQLLSNLSFNQSTYYADFVVKTQGSYIQGYRLKISQSSGIEVTSLEDGISIPSDQDDLLSYCEEMVVAQSTISSGSVYLEYYTENEELAGLLAQYAEVRVLDIDFSQTCSITGMNTVQPSVYTHLVDDPMSTNVVGWGQFGWVGDDDAILRDELRPMDYLDPAFLADAEALETDDDEMGLIALRDSYGLDPMSDAIPFRMFVPERGEEVEQSYFDPVTTSLAKPRNRYKLIYSDYSSVFKRSVSLEVLGEDPTSTPVTPNYTQVSNFNRPAPNQSTFSNNTGILFGGSFAIAKGFGGSLTRTEIIPGLSTGAETTSSIMDVNGDGYPDNLQQNGDAIDWQSTNILGGYTGALTTFDPDAIISNNRYYAGGSNLGAGAGRKYATQFALSFQGSLGVTTGTTNFRDGLIDLNGDGLPDLFSAYNEGTYSTGNDLTVFFGNGNGLEAIADNLDYQLSYLSNTETDIIGPGAGGSVTVNVGLWQFGGGVNTGATANEIKTERRVIDFNGDGLLDVITKDKNPVTGNYYPWMVRINTGLGFASPENIINEHDFEDIDSDVFSESVSAYVSIPMPWLGITLQLGTSGVSSSGNSKSTELLADVNGDGEMVPFVKQLFCLLK